MGRVKPMTSTPQNPRDELVTHLGALRAFALNLTRNDATADDLVQDTIVKAWKNIDRFEVGTNMRAWLYTILRNTFYSDYRKKRREVQDSDGIFAATLSVKPDHDGRLAMGDFMKAFDQLNDEQREALTLVGASGYAYHEAAEICGVATGTMKSRVGRARARLAELLEFEQKEFLDFSDNRTSGSNLTDLTVYRD